MSSSSWVGAAFWSVLYHIWLAACMAPIFQGLYRQGDRNCTLYNAFVNLASCSSFESHPSPPQISTHRQAHSTPRKDLHPSLQISARIPIPLLIAHPFISRRELLVFNINLSLQCLGLVVASLLPISRVHQWHRHHRGLQGPNMAR